jgi:hypothetical protein
VGVGVGSPNRGKDEPHSLRADDSVKRATELRVPVADEEADRARPSVEVQYDRLRFTASSKLDIDHVVPLAEAWDSGAWRWTAARRQAFANDLGKSWVLIAVSAHSNRSKGDRDPSGWMPTSASYTCRYLAVWVAIKARWHLTVDPVEKRAIASFTSCRNTAVPG